MDIKVLGPGCAKCQQTEKVVKEAVAEAGVSATVEKVTDIRKIAEYGVFGTPAVVVDGEVKMRRQGPEQARCKEMDIQIITGSKDLMEGDPTWKTNAVLRTMRS